MDFTSTEVFEVRGGLCVGTTFVLVRMLVGSTQQGHGVDHILVHREGAVNNAGAWDVQRVSGPVLLVILQIEDSGRRDQGVRPQVLERRRRELRAGGRHRWQIHDFRATGGFGTFGVD